ncbi:MAG TPA: DUF58 domain-containing protein [Candidatus Angelobacter sp.]|nr:DUF58 domain-containing protein [Candidatus Angelobacter sp.]
MRLPGTLKSVLANIDGEAWLRFVMAILGLTLAFVAALLSTIARETGNVAATALFASTALLLAGTVGVIVVPYLAKRVVGSRVRDALDFEITREGMAYLGVALVIGIAALNTTNNLLFIVLAAMLAAIVVSGFASAAMLRGLELDVSLPESAFAGKPITAHVKLHNPRRAIPAFSVRVASRFKSKKKKKPGWEWHKTEFIFPRQNHWLRLPDYALRRRTQQAQSPPIFENPVYFTFLPARTTLDAQVELTFSSRGRYTQDNFYLATRFPFSFLIKSRRVKLCRELMVFPALLESRNFLELLSTITGEHSTMLRGPGSELYRIREHTPQDSARFVDWKAAAKTGSLKVREFAREDERRLRIVFDNSTPGVVSPQAYERAVSVAASLAWHLTQEGVDLSYAAPFYAGGSHLHDFLGYLSVVQPAPDESILNSLPASSDYNVIITGRKPGSIPSALWASAYVIYMDEA